MKRLTVLALSLVIAVIMVFPFGLETRGQTVPELTCPALCELDIMTDGVRCCVDDPGTQCFTNCEIDGGVMCEEVSMRECITTVTEAYTECMLQCRIF